jgi:hypothetical protein
MCRNKCLIVKQCDEALIIALSVEITWRKLYLTLHAVTDPYSDIHTMSNLESE